MSDALFTKTQQRLLGLLFGNPNRSYYVKELVLLANTGTGSIQRQLEKFTEAGLVTVKKIGNQKHYRANRNAPLFEELRSIAVKTFGIADVVRRALQPFAKRIRIAFIYGSVAHGSDTAESDIDILIVSQNLSYTDLFAALARSEKKLGRTVDPKVYKPAEFRQKLDSDNAFLKRTLKRPVIYLIGSRDDVERMRK